MLQIVPNKLNEGRSSESTLIDGFGICGDRTFHPLVARTLPLSNINEEELLKIAVQDLSGGLYDDCDGDVGVHGLAQTAVTKRTKMALD